MIVTRNAQDGGSTAYFKDEAQSGIRAFLMHIGTTEAPDRRNLLTLRRYITSQEARLVRPARRHERQSSRRRRDRPRSGAA